MNQRIPYRVPSSFDARERLLTIYEVDLPIEGGWGYDIEDAVVINKLHPSVNQEMPFHGVGIEKTFIRHRLFIELIQMRSRDDDFSGIESAIKIQRVIQQNGKSYDHLECEATALRTADWLLMKEIWEGSNGYKSPDFDQAKHLQLHKSKLVHFDCEYWFDITSFIHDM